MNNDLVVDLREAFAHITHQTRRLLAMAAQWASEPTPPLPADDAEPSYQRRQQPSLSERLGADGVQTLIERYRKGVPARELAENYACSVITVRRLLQAHGVRR